MSEALYSLKIKKLPKSTLEIKAVIPVAEWESYKEEALRELNNHVSLDGFRKGKVPEALLIQKVGEFALLEEMAEIAISRAYHKMIVSEKLHPIGKPKVELTKIAKGNPLEFTLTTAVFPEITLPDYKKIAKNEGEIETLSVSEKEIEETITDILRMRAHQEEDSEGKEGSENAPLPELTEELVKKLGNFESVADFKTKLNEQILKEKTQKAMDKRRNKILDAVGEKTTVDLPDILIDGEVERMIDQFKGDITRVGGTWEGYLEHAKKTDADLRKEWRPDAEKRARIQLAIDTIAETEKLEPTKENIDREVAPLIAMYPDADKERAYDYIRFTLRNRMVIDLLENAHRA